MKKLLDSDWVRAVQFKCNTSAKSVKCHTTAKKNCNTTAKTVTQVQKNVTPLQITHRNLGL